MNTHVFRGPQSDDDEFDVQIGDRVVAQKELQADLFASQEHEPEELEGVVVYIDGERKSMKVRVDDVLHNRDVVTAKVRPTMEGQFVEGGAEDMTVYGILTYFSRDGSTAKIKDTTGRVYDCDLRTVFCVSPHTSEAKAFDMMRLSQEEELNADGIEHMLAGDAEDDFDFEI